MAVKTSRTELSPGNLTAVKAMQEALGQDCISTRELDRIALAVDASHYLMTPDAIMRPKSAKEVGVAMAVAVSQKWPLTLRSGGSSLSGQALSNGLLVDVRRNFRDIEVLDDGKRVRVQPGATINQTNARLARYGYQLGPDPASSVACTIGGMIANNSSGMTCGTTKNTYRTIESMTIVLPSGTVIDTGAADADYQLKRKEPALFEVLERLRDQLRKPELKADIERRYAIKNTMGYGMNSFIDFDQPVKILEHLMVGSEGTLGFVAEAYFKTIKILPKTTTGMLVFNSLDDATNVLPDLVYSGAATVELIDSASMLAMGEDAKSVLPDGFKIDQQAALLVEYQGENDDQLAELLTGAEKVFSSAAGLASTPEMTSDKIRRAQMWILRNGLYTRIAGNRPKGTASLLEDVAVPMEDLGSVCAKLQVLFDRHNYQNAVIFGHAKDGNIHFLVTEDFANEKSLKRYEDFTEDLVDLILDNQGTLKAEHGTGRIMAPFVHRQYGDQLYQAMWDIKYACDPTITLNPGAVLTEDPNQHLRNIKTTDPVRNLIDDCVECGYCEAVCPSQHLTTTPRQRIVIQRAISSAQSSGNTQLFKTLKAQEKYDVIQTCAVDSMCVTTCPMKINTGDLIRTLRTEEQSHFMDSAWDLAAKNWGGLLKVASTSMNIAEKMPTGLIRGALGTLRALTSEDIVPILAEGMPGGGPVRLPVTKPNPDAIFMPSCVGTAFGTQHPHSKGVTGALRELAEATGLALATPPGIQGLCCGTVWKSKGLAKGYATMKERLVDWIIRSTDDGKLPLICDAVSCSEGVIIALKNAGLDHIQVLDATQWVAKYVAPKLPPLETSKLAVVHPTCSSTHLAATDAFLMLAGLVADEVIVPDGWRCCGFAGDRGLLHEELTATSTKDEAASVKKIAEADLYLSLNRPCEIGMSRATGKTYSHVLEELAYRLKQLETASV